MAIMKIHGASENQGTDLRNLITAARSSVISLT